MDKYNQCILTIAVFVLVVVDSRPVTECGYSNYLGTKGNITSPNFPGSYPANIKCKWLIEVHKGSSVSLKFTPNFSLDTSLDCNNGDYVEVFDVYGGIYINHVVSMGRWCGTRKPPTLVSQTTTLLVVFESDNKFEGRGFNAIWKSVSNCGGKFYRDSGFLMTPNYPRHYTNNLKCHWTIVPPQDGKIMLTFDHIFDIERGTKCQFDSVRVNVKGNGLERYCGNSPPAPIVTTNKIITVDFSSDSDIVKKGFMLSWKRL